MLTLLLQTSDSLGTIQKMNDALPQYIVGYLLSSTIYDFIYVSAFLGVVTLFRKIVERNRATHGAITRQVPTLMRSLAGVVVGVLVYAFLLALIELISESRLSPLVREYAQNIWFLISGFVAAYMTAAVSGREDLKALAVLAVIAVALNLFVDTKGFSWETVTLHGLAYFAYKFIDHLTGSILGLLGGAYARIRGQFARSIFGVVAGYLLLSLSACAIIGWQQYVHDPSQPAGDLQDLVISVLAVVIGVVAGVLTAAVSNRNDFKAVAALAVIDFCPTAVVYILSFRTLYSHRGPGQFVISVVMLILGTISIIFGGFLKIRRLRKLGIMPTQPLQGGAESKRSKPEMEKVGRQ